MIKNEESIYGSTNCHLVDFIIFTKGFTRYGGGWSMHKDSQAWIILEIRPAMLKLISDELCQTPLHRQLNFAILRIDKFECCPGTPMNPPRPITFSWSSMSILFGVYSRKDMRAKAALWKGMNSLPIQMWENRWQLICCVLRVKPWSTWSTDSSLDWTQ